MTNVFIAHEQDGAGVYCTGGTTYVDSCTFVSNSTWGIENVSGTADVKNTIAWFNTSGGISNCAVTYSCSQEAQAGTGNTTADPLFFDTTYYHLDSKLGVYSNGYFTGGTWRGGGANSPLISKGDPDSPRDNQPTPSGPKINIGAYGNTSVASLYPFGGTVFFVR